MSHNTDGNMEGKSWPGQVLQIFILKRKIIVVQQEKDEAKSSAIFKTYYWKYTRHELIKGTDTSQLYVGDTVGAVINHW